MYNKRAKRGSWTIERCFEEAKKYKHRSTFKKESGRAYSVLRENHLLDEACKHMIKMDTITKWTKENCIEAAKQCKTKSEFNSKFCGAMRIAKKRGWYNELLQYFIPVGSKYKRCIYACEFSDNHAYVGLTYNFEKRKKDHLRDKESSIFKYISLTKLKPLFKQVTEYLDYQEAAIKEGEVLNEYKNNGWLMLNRVPTGGLGGKDEIVRKWTEEKCIEVAKTCPSYTFFSQNYKSAMAYCQKHNIVSKIKEILHPKHSHTLWTKESALEESEKYNTIKEFSEKNSGAYLFLLKNGFQKEMRENKTLLQRDEWTLEEAQQEALKYDTKKTFREGSYGCYGVCQKRGWIDIVCSHMRNLNDERKIYNERNVKEVVQKYNYMQQLRESDDKFVRGCYWWLKGQKRIEEFKRYLNKDDFKKKNIPWTDEMLENEYKKYNTYKEFRETSKAYQICRKRKMLDKIKNYFKNEKN